MEAVRAATNPEGPRIRHLLNWGRSAIEGRSAKTPLEHVGILGDGLGAFAFSGAAPVATDRSAEWEDVHLGLVADEPGSLLDADGTRRLLTKLPDELSYLGIKTGAPAGSRGTERLQPLLHLVLCARMSGYRRCCAGGILRGPVPAHVVYGGQRPARHGRRRKAEPGGRPAPGLMTRQWSTSSLWAPGSPTGPATWRPRSCSSADCDQQGSPAWPSAPWLGS